MKKPFQEIKQNNFIIGRNPVLEAIEQDIQIDKVFIQVGVRGDFEKDLRKACKQKLIPLSTVPKEKLNQYYRGNHQGVLAFASSIIYYKLEDILPFAYEKAQAPVFVVLDGITDMRNFGAIARSCEIFGVQAIIIAKKGGALINEDAIKTSAGALLHIPVCREQSLASAVEFLQDSGVSVYSASLKSTANIDSCDFNSPTAIVIGAEGRGVNPDLEQKIKNQFKIPQSGKTDSLNASVAAGIILYEIMRQRKFI